MVEFVLQVLQETWSILKEASVFLLLGFILAGALAVLVPARTLMRFLGNGRVKSVLWASALGAPLPLCSCGVLPTALGLRRQGATEGATVAFLISTPETDLEAISLTYALMDPIMTVFRPAAGVVTAITAGLAVNFFGESRARGRPALAEGPEPPDGAAARPPGQHGHAAHDCCHDHAHGPEPDKAAGRGGPAPIASRQTAKRIYTYAFHELLDETSYWVILGIVLSGVVAAALPPAFFAEYLSGELTSMLVMLFIGIPIYTCASASTPVVAALVLKGLNPGAALVFLLAGPATSVASLTVLPKFLGIRVVAIYLGAIAVVALLAGYALNRVYEAWDLDPRATFGSATAFMPEPVKVAGALVLIVLLFLSVRRTHVPVEWIWLRDRLADLTGVRLTRTGMKAGAVAAVALLYAASGLFTVQPGEVGVRTWFGEIIAPSLAPGLHYRLPWPFEDHRIVQTDPIRRVEFGFRSEPSPNITERAQARDRLTVGGPSNPVPATIEAMGLWFQQQMVDNESFLLTGDGNFIDIQFTVQYRVTDPIAYAYSIAEPEALVRSLTLAAVRGAVATSGIDAVYTDSRRDVEERVRRAVQGLLDGYRAGIELLSVRLLYVHPPEEVHDAFRDVASAQEDKLRTINRAQTFAVEDVNRARGEAAAMIEAALASREERVLRARGDAAGFTLKADEYERAPGLTRFRLQLETIEEVLPGVQKFVRPGADTIKELDLWLLEPFGVGGSR